MLSIYISSPISTYKDEKGYLEKVIKIKNHFPDANLLQARGLYSSTQDWKNKWPETLRKVDILVFFTDSYGYIGAGVYQEIVDALFAGKPVYYLDTQGDLMAQDEISLRLIGNDFYQFASVITGGGHGTF